MYPGVGTCVLIRPAQTFYERIKDAQISAYVKKLEERYDEALTLKEMPQPEELVKDLEAFLKEQQRRNGEDRVSP